MIFYATGIMGMQAWHAQQGNWSFLILKDETGFICSYKNFSLEKLSVTFKETEEFHSDDINSVAPSSYYYFNLKEAQRACKEKYRELLLR